MKNDLTALNQYSAFCPLPWIHNYLGVILFDYKE